jgi:hypothetical protein
MVTRVSSGRRAYIALGVVLASVASVALAATFNLFQPASGILKGNPSTYITTAATSADVVATFSGTCNSGTVLKGDGSCAAASTGTVTSVALTAPTGLTVTGSPVTTSGTLGLTTTLSGVVHGNGSGFTAGNVALGSEVSGLLPVANGGIGVGTLTGLAKGNGTSAFTSAVASDVYGLWAGGCSSSNFLRGDGTCASPGGGGTVTSVAMTVPAFLSVSGSPVTSSGTLGVSLSGTALPVLNGGTGTTTSTGTGNVVLSASPTLTGTVTAGTVAATAVTVGGNNVCQSTGTNCPASSGVTSLTSGTGIALSPSTITSTGSISVTGLKVVWARVQSTGTLTDSGGFGGTSITSVTKGTTGKYQLNWSGSFSTGPACTCSVTQSSAIYVCMNDAGTGQVLTQLVGTGVIDVSFQVHCIGT